MEYLSNLFKIADNLGKTSPVVAGFVAMAMTGALGFVLIKTPRHIFHFINNVLFVSFEVNNSGWGKNQEVFVNIIRWFYEFKGFKLTRTYSFEGSNYSDDAATGAGPGRHFIIYKGLPLYWVIQNLDSGGSEKQKRVVYIKTLFFLRKRFFKFMDEITSKKNRAFVPAIYEFSPNERFWRRCNELSPRNIDTVILNEGVKEEIIELIENFYASEEWYLSRGIPYKLIIMFYGPPGTGKTSTMKSLASHFKKNICPAHLHALSDTTFVNCVNSIPDSSFLILEDIDTCGSLSKRQSDKKLQTKEEDPAALLDSLSSGGLNLSTILNTLDGVAELNNKVILLSTNHPEKIDKAFYRTQRVDKCILIDFLNEEAVRRYTAMAYPEDYEAGTFPTFDAKIPGSVLQEIFMSNKDSYSGFIAMLNERIENGVGCRDLEKLNF